MNNETFNPEMLAIARDFRGYSQTQAAKKCEISQAKYSKIENGVTVPDQMLLSLFEDKFGFPEKFFLKNARAIGVPMSFHEMYRKPKSVGVKSLSKVSADLSIRMFCLSKLLKSIDLEPELHLPEYDIEDYGGDGAEIARMVRRTWLIPNGAIKDLSQLVEKAGIIIFPCFFPTPKVDGVTVNIAGMPPVIFINENATADRARFSLAHELGHVIMHRQMSNTMEQEANDFASELLMPEMEMRSEFSNRVDMKELARLKRIRKTSMAALLYKATKIGKVTKNQSAYLWRQLAPYRLKEPAQFDKEIPSTLKNILQLFIKNMSYSNSDFAETFDLTEELVKHFFGNNVVEERKLKLVV